MAVEMSLPLELRSGARTWAFRREGGDAQEDENTDIWELGVCPAMQVGHTDEKVIFW